MLSRERKNAFIENRFNTLFPYLNEYGDEATIKKGIEEDFDSLLELTDMKICQKRCDYFKLKGVKPEDFKERVIDLGNGKEFLAGIRFRALVVEKPFVAVWLNFPELNSELLKELSVAVKEEFKMFNPLWIAFQLQLSSKLDNCELGDYTILGSIKSLVKDIDSSDVTLELAHDLDFYEKYSSEYDLFHKENPILAKEVKKESLEDLQESVDSSLLFKVKVSGEFAGIIAGRVEDYNGIKGICILEKLIFSKFRSQGYGRISQQMFINLLAERDLGILWGTIFHQNHGSLKTAMNTGRKIVEVESFFKLD